jgi:TP901 family phage tail tape measure protein
MTPAGDSLGVATLELAANPAPLDATLASVQKRTEARMNAMEAMSGKKVATVGQNMSRLGSQWTRTVSLPIIGGGAAMIKVASDFEAALTQVQTQAGASSREIHGMREAILKLAPTVGKTPVELANALFHIESAGLRGAKALDVMTQSAKLAQIGHSDLESTTSALVAVMRSAPKDVRNATDAIGIMNAVVGQGNLRMNDLVGALSTGLIPRAKSVGLGLRDVGAALDVMTARGIPAQAAATRLNMTLSLMSAPTAKARDALKSVGITGLQLATDMRKPDGLVIAVEDLKKHMDAAGLSATQQNKLISQAFGGGRTSGAMLTLIQNTHDLEKAFDGIGKHSGAQQVREEWKKTQEDTGFRWEKLKAKASVEFVDIGEKIAPTFLRVAGQIADDATGIARAFTSLPKGAQDLIIAGGLTAAALGPVLRLAGVLTTFVGRTWDALKVAKELATGSRSIFGGASSALKAGQSVATMEVGEMIVKTMIGGGPGGGPGGAIRSGEKAAAGAGAAEGAATLSAAGFGGAAALAAGVTLGPFAAGILNPTRVPPQLQAGRFGPTSRQAQSVMTPQQVQLIKDATVAVKQFGSTGNADGINRIVVRIKALEKQFPQTKAAMQGLLTTMSIATHGTVPSLANAVKSAGNDIADKFGDKMKTARDIVQHTTGDARKYAIQNVTRLQTQASGQFDTLERNVAKQQGRMTASIRTGSKNLAAVAGENFGKFEASVRNAMASGVIATSKGMRLITQALNATLKAFGEKPLSLSQISAATPGQLGALASGQVSSGAFASPHARGGMLPIGRPGYPGRDNIPMNIGGQDVVVGEGETAVIFNRHQMPEVNARFADQGGLPGFFAARRRPNYLSTGGYVYPFPPGTTVGRTDEGVDANMPVGAPIGPIGDATIKGVHPNWYQGQPIMWWQLRGGPRAGRYVYLAEQINKLSSGNITAHQAAAHYAPSGTGIEMGWATAAGEALAHGHYSEGQATAEGQDFRNFITGLAHGVIRGGSGVGGATLKNILAPKVHGKGTIPSIVRAALGKAASAANAYESSHAPSPSMTGMGASTSFGSVGKLRGGGRFVATAYGPPWGGIEGEGVTSTGIDLHGAPHKYIIAVDPTVIPYHSQVKVQPNPFGYAGTFAAEDTGGAIKGNRIDFYDWMGRAHQNAWGRRNVTAEIVRRFAQGGIVKGFAAGGIPQLRSIHRQRPSHAPTPTAPLPPLLDKTTSKAFNTMNRILGDGNTTPGEVAVLQDRDQSLQNIFGTTPYGGISTAADAIVTPTTGAPYVDQSLVSGRLGQLQQMLFIETGVERDLEAVWRLIPGLLVRLQRALKNRKRRIEQIKARIKANLAKIKGITALVTGEKKRKFKTAGEKHASQKRVDGWNGSIKGLKDENQALGGDRDKIGTGGEIGKLSLDALTTDITAVQSNQQAVGGASGIGGSLGAAKIDVLNTTQAIQALAPNAVGLALAAAGANAGTGASGTASQLASLLQTQNDQLSQQLAVSQDQYRVLSQLPPYAGKFHMGGVIPGPEGAERMALVKAGETINPAGSGGDVHVYVDRKSDLHQLIDVRVEKVTRGQARSAAPGGRVLPGARAGQTGRR